MRALENRDRGYVAPLPKYHTQQDREKKKTVIRGIEKGRIRCDDDTDAVRFEALRGGGAGRNGRKRNGGAAPRESEAFYVFIERMIAAAAAAHESISVH